MADNKIAELVNALLRKGSQALDNQEYQKKVARLLGVADETALAIKTSDEWQSDTKYEDAYGDTLNHLLLGGLTTPTSWLKEPRKGLANALMNVRERSFVEEPSVEDQIDINNNDFGVALAKQMMDDGTYTQDAFIKKAQQYVAGMAEGKEYESVEGLYPQLSTSGTEPSRNRPRFRQPVKMPFLGYEK